MSENRTARGWIVTAHDFSSGAGVFLTKAREWSRDPGSSAFATDERTRDELLAAAQRDQARGRVELVAAIEARKDGQGRIRPSRLRERLRALGPSVRPDLWEPAATGRGEHVSS